MAGYSPTYDVGAGTLVWAGSHFRRHDGRVATVDMFAPSDLLQGPHARSLLVEGVASLLRRGRVLAHVTVRRPGEVGFFVSPMPDDWDEGEMQQGMPTELAEQFADGLLVCSVMES